MQINPAIAARLVALAQAVASAPRGAKQALYASACAELGLSLPTLYRHLEQVMVKTPRKQRSDAGAVALSREEAVIISALLTTSHRKTGKRLLSVGQAVDILRANAEVRAEYITPDGEIKQLSESAIARALRAYGLHPDQLNRPAPASELKSLHPNHVWQIDASLCVLYYLKAKNERECGLQVMDRDKFYKNKPANLKSIEADRVWSYEGTDHNSGTIMLHYVNGAESGTNLAEAFIQFTQKRDADPVHGVPFILMMDMGSANTSGLFGNLARRLQVKLLPHAPGNARATGQVENARNIIERSFESSLRLAPVANLEQLNTQAQRWSTWYNGNKVHSRHGKTRFDQWMTISADQLRVAPPPDICYELLTHSPEQRKVSDTLTVSFRGREFDVQGVPSVMIGEKLEITLNPYVANAAMVVLKNADGHELLQSIAEVERNEDGFRADANVIGEGYRSRSDTVLEANRKQVKRVAYNAATDEEADARAKAGAIPFASRIDPYKVIEQAPKRVFMPKRGTDLVTSTTTASTTAAPRVLSAFEVAQWLANAGTAMDRDKAAQVRAWYPDGVPEDQLAELQARLTVRAGLRLVAAGAGA